MIHVTILSGISGSGKSRYVKKNLGNQHFNVVCPDEIRKRYFGDVNDQRAGRYVFGLAHAELRLYLTAFPNVPVIWDATTTSMWAYKSIVKTAMSVIPEEYVEGKDYKINLAVFKADVELSHSRIVKDIEEGKDRANVPLEVLKKQAKQLSKFMGELYKEKITFEYIK